MAETSAHHGLWQQNLAASAPPLRMFSAGMRSCASALWPHPGQPHRVTRLHLARTTILNHAHLCCAVLQDVEALFAPRRRGPWAENQSGSDRLAHWGTATELVTSLAASRGGPQRAMRRGHACRRKETSNPSHTGAGGGDADGEHCHRRNRCSLPY
jgi:hypothetical protein